MKKRIQLVQFPQDHGPHSAITEWWYFNGHVKDRAGKRYGFMDCLFRVNVEKVNIPFLNKVPFKKLVPTWPYVYFAHSIVSDIASGKSYKSVQNISLISHDSFPRDRFFVNYIDPMIFRGYVNNEIAETEPFRFHVKGDLLDLDFLSRKAPLLEGGGGYLALNGKGTYYYSLTDLATKGSLSMDGKRIEVEGRGWMDHQWADVPYSADTWTWFCLQLDDGTDIMCVEYDDHDRKILIADVMNRYGVSTHGHRVMFTPGKQVWKSAKTKAEYPMTWTIDIPEKRISLNVRALLKDQEMIYGTINYWECPIEVEGMVKRKKVKGVGYMELVGYPSDYSYLALVEKEFIAQIKKTLVAGWKRMGRR